MSIRLGELAARFGCELTGDPDVVIRRVASLDGATGDSLTFLANPAFKANLQSTRAGAVIVRREHAAEVPVAALIHDNPYATYARMAAPDSMTAVAWTPGSTSTGGNSSAAMRA